MTVYMATYKTKAIILSSYPYREYDRIVSFFSEDYGRIDARARGSRKLASKLAGHLEPFIETELLLARGRHWDILAGSRTVSPQALLRERLELSAAAAVCCEAIKHIAKPLAPDARVWRLLRGTLAVLGDFPGQDTVYRFLWRLAALSGFAPEIKKCIHCRRRVNEGYFSREGGGALCADCRGRDPLAVKMASRDLAALDGRQDNLSAPAREIIIGWWRAVVNHAPLKSWEFWESL